MEDEIDLRVYIDLLLRQWKWIVGTTVVSALVSGVIAFLIPPTYEATAVVFELSSPATGGPQTLLTPQTQLAIMQGKAVAQRVVDSLDGELSNSEKEALLRGDVVRVAPDAADKSLFKITVQANTAQKASDIANAWANAGADQINQVQNEARNLSISMLQQSVETAAKDLQVAEENLKRMQRDIQIDLLTQEITRTQNLLDTQFAERENVKSALAQENALKQQVQQGQISLSAEMLLNFQMVATTAGSSFLIQPSQFINLTKQQQLDQLDTIIAALNSRQQALSTSISSVMFQAATLQQELNDKQTALIEPTRTRDTARANYDRATAQLRDAQMRLATQQDPAHMISSTVPPDSPVAPKKALNVAVGGALGLLVSVIGVFAAGYLSKPRST